MKENPSEKTRENDLFGRSAEIRRFLRTTPSNRATVSQFLHDVELELASYHTEINRLKTAIYALETRRDRLERAAERYKSLLSPIHIVPSEILTTIFNFACEWKKLSRDALPDTLRLSMVCGRWRDIIFSTSRLWASIEIDFDEWTTDLYVLKQLSELFIERSKASPLRLSLVLPGDDYSGSPAAKEEILSILRAVFGQCERWKDVALDVVPQDFPSSIFDSIRAVEHLRLVEVGGLDESNNDHSSHVVNSGVKALRTMSAKVQGDVDGVLKHTTLGGLSSLRIWGERGCLTDEWPTWDNTCLEAFLQRSSCFITSLHLDALPIIDMQVLALLRLIPTITSLCVGELSCEQENRIVTASFLDGLNTSLDSVPLAPQLTHLKVRVHAHNLASDAFLKALSSRWLPDPRHARKIGVECLHFVTIVVIVSSEQDQKDGHLDCLDCFKDAGMRLAITYGTFSELYPGVDNEDEEEDGEGEEEGEEEGDGSENASDAKGIWAVIARIFVALRVVSHRFHDLAIKSLFNLDAMRNMVDLRRLEISGMIFHLGAIGYEKEKEVEEVKETSAAFCEILRGTGLEELVVHPSSDESLPNFRIGLSLEQFAGFGGLKKVGWRSRAPKFLSLVRLQEMLTAHLGLEQDLVL
ncbi:hypothetical protein AAF712_007219 [Marasmius tenuissimus]|uniref:F-box domain-containing protein n=1 Tax=Marasmius tenuissimus TaxID=585030 RepID=A0ABR2ZVH7_9AGAR